MTRLLQVARPQRLAMALALLTAFLPLLGLFWRWAGTGVMPAGLLHDDAYALGRMALSWYHGGGLGLNDVEAASAFQPLPVLFALLLALLSLGHAQAFLVLQVAAVALINAVVMWLFAHLYRPRLGGVLAWLLPLVLMLVFQPVFSWGMETLLAIPALHVMVASLFRRDWRRPDYRIMGALLVWLFLVRADSLVLLPLLVVWCRWRHRARPGELALLALPVLAAVMLCAGIDLLRGGSLLPVGELAVSAGTPRVANFVVFGLPDGPLRPLVLCLGALFCLAELAYGRRYGDTAGRWVVLGLMLAVLLQFAALAVLTGWGAEPWQGWLVVAVLTAMVLRIWALTTPASGGRPRGGHRVMRLLVLACLLAATVCQVLAARHDAGRERGVVERNYRDARAGVFAGKTVIMGDPAGSLAFWEPRARVVPVDGRFMSGAFLDSRAQGQGNAWVDERYRVSELVVDRPWLPTMNYGADRIYLVVQPVQALIWQDMPMVYCFPEFAVLAEEHGADFSRIRFDYDERMVCPQALMDWLNGVNRRGQLNQLTFNLRPEGWRHTLRELDLWMALRGQPPRHVIQDISEPE